MRSANIGTPCTDEGLIASGRAPCREQVASGDRDRSRAPAKRRARYAQAEDVHGGTFTENQPRHVRYRHLPRRSRNLGETGILGVGRIVEKPAVFNGEIAKRAMIWLSLTFDHRVVMAPRRPSSFKP